MTRFIARRLLILPLLLILVNFLSFTYAFYARPLRAERTPFVAVEDPGELIPSYIDYLTMVFDLDFGMELAVPGSLRVNTPSTMGEVIRNATIASLGLLAITLTLSSIIGFFMGRKAVQNESNKVARWLSMVTTMGLAMPSFYVGSILIFLSVAYILWRGPGSDSPFPLDGFGWDLHLVLPVAALMARPTVQLAQVTANFLSGELGKQYVIAARSLGYTWRSIRNQYALKNILAPVILTIAGLSRLIFGEQILIEWLFRWPGLGRLLAWTLVPAQLTSSKGSPLFLNPPVMATIITIIAAIFLLGDLIGSILVRFVDPRLRNPETEVIDRK